MDRTIKIVLTIGCAVVAAAPAWAAGVTERVSVSSREIQGNDASLNNDTSATGRFVAFDSAADNLVSGDTNANSDVFVRDLKTGKTERVSVGAKGAQGDSASDSPAISCGGRYVAFSSAATNLVRHDTNPFSDMFVRDRQAGTTELVSVSSGGAQGIGDVFGVPAISCGGRFVAFITSAAGLVPGDTNGEADVFVHDRRTGRTERVNLGPHNVQANGGSTEVSISGDGRYVAFQSEANNLVPNDTNGFGDVFVRDRKTGRTVRASVGPGGTELQFDFSDGPSLSASGRYLAFRSKCDGVVPGSSGSQIYIRDLTRSTNELASVGPGGQQGDISSFGPVLAAGGRYVAFISRSQNLVPEPTPQFQLDVYVHDRTTGLTRRVDVGPGGVQANAASLSDASISGDGSVVAFASFATDLVPHDTNGFADVFVRTPHH